MFCLHSFNGTSEQAGAWSTLITMEENFSDSESSDADDILFKEEATTDWLSFSVIQLLNNSNSKNLRFALGFIRAPPTPRY
jgi:hypothetical protein